MCKFCGFPFKGNAAAAPEAVFPGALARGRCNQFPYKGMPQVYLGLRTVLKPRLRAQSFIKKTWGNRTLKPIGLLAAQINRHPCGIRQVYKTATRKKSVRG
jgi:hypothetical protein